MNEPRRPDADLTLAERLRELMSGRAVVDNHPDRRVEGRFGGIAELADAGGDGARGTYSAAVVTAIGVGAIVMVAGLFWAWQSWSGRSAAPIDDSLPFLIDTGTVGDTDAAEARGSDGGQLASPAVDGSGTDTAEPAVLPGATSGELDELATDEGEAPGDLSGPDPTVTPAPMLVHVSGAVQRPGVVELSAGARAVDALGAAGGALVDTDLDRVNLAAPLFDGERLHFPVVGEDDPPEIVEPVRPYGFDDDQSLYRDERALPAARPTPTPRPVIVDINSAGLVELQQLPGIGPAMASRIVEKRQSYGFFCTVDELLDIRGIGPDTLDNLRSSVRIQSADCLNPPVG